MPDGRPLHTYKLSVEACESLEGLLVDVAKSGRLQKHNREDAALFVLWAADWFRRHYGGGIRKYEDLGRVLGIRFDDQKYWRALVDDGLDWWRRPVIRRASGSHRLLTLALEGGFPARVLEERERGWLVRYLVGLVSALLALPDVTPEASRDLAWARRAELRETYQEEGFCALAADLALSIIRLRREAEQASLEMPGLSPSAVLDAVRPDWRADLSIASEGEAARRLIDGMMAAPIQATSGGEVGVTRQLLLRDGIWCPAVRLGLSGQIATKNLHGFWPRDGRIRVFPHGSLSRAVGREIAMLDPPGDVDGTWLLRPLLTQADIIGVPLSSPIEVSLQAVGRAALTMRWPQGKSVVGDVLSFAIDSESGGKPTRLTLVAEGSAGLRSDRIVVAAPIDWQLESDREQVQSLGLFEKTRELWLTECSVVFSSPDGSFAYRIEPGQTESTRHELAFSGPSPTGLASESEELSLFAGAPSIFCTKGGLRSRPTSGEVYWRTGPNDPWVDATTRRLSPGLIDVIWKDSKTKFVFDRQRVCVLPENAGVSVTVDSNAATYAFRSIEPLTVEVMPVAGLSASVVASIASVRFVGKPHRRITFRLRVPGKERAILATALFPYAGGIAWPDGELVDLGATLTPATLQSLTAFGKGRQGLAIRSHDRQSRDAEAIQISFDEEMPLRGVADQLDRALRMAGSIDSTFLIELTANRRAYYYAKWFDCSLEVRDTHLLVSSIPGLRELTFELVGRPVEAPFAETKIADVTISDMLNRRWFRLPEDSRGTWMVYLRTGLTIRSRPVLVVAPGRQVSNGRGLAAASAETSTAKRRLAFASAIKRAEANDAESLETLHWLRSLICSLEGLPAVTFDAMKELACHPAVLARLLLSGLEAEQPAIWALENELSFLWSALPVKGWQAAATAATGALEQQLSEKGLAKAARELAEASVNEAAQRVRALDPTLDAALSAAGLGTAPPVAPPINLQSVAADYVRRTADREELQRSPQASLFRRGQLERLLPSEFAVFSPEHLQTLDAPCAAALSAAGRADLSAEQLAVCKNAVTADPAYYAQAYAVTLHRALSRAHS